MIFRRVYRIVYYQLCSHYTAIEMSVADWYILMTYTEKSYSLNACLQVNNCFASSLVSLKYFIHILQLRRLWCSFWKIMQVLPSIFGCLRRFEHLSLDDIESDRKHRSTIYPHLGMLRDLKHQIHKVNTIARRTSRKLRSLVNQIRNTLTNNKTRIFIMIENATVYKIEY